MAKLDPQSDGRAQSTVAVLEAPVREVRRAASDASLIPVIGRRQIPRLTRGDWAALAGVGTWLLVLLLTLRHGFDDLDDGYFFMHAWRVLHGQMPYRDFSDLYTPGLLYLHAGILHLLGMNLVWLHLLGIGFRLMVALLSYLLARTVIGPRFSLVPATLVLLGLDAAPSQWEPHPGWPSTVLMLATVLLLTQLPLLRGRMKTGALLAVGALAGATFAFKQNTGVFTLLGAGWFLLLHGRGIPDFGAAQRPPISLLGLSAIGIAALAALIGGYANAWVYGYLLAPLVAIVLLRFMDRAGPGSGEHRGIELLDLLLVGAGCVLTTAPWLTAVLVAVGGQFGLLASFIGAVNQAPLFFPLELPSAPTWPALGMALIALLLVRLRAARARAILLATALVALLEMIGLTAGDGEPLASAILQAPGRSGLGLALLVPTVSFWWALWFARRAPQSLREWRLRCFLFVGSVVFFAQYPRLDVTHLAWSSPVLLVAGAAALERGFAWLTGRWGLRGGLRTALAFAMLTLPAFAILPTMYWRMNDLVDQAPSGLPVPYRLSTANGVPAVNGLTVPSDVWDDVRRTVFEIQQRTQPNEPIFVYPSSPLLYVLADRPNPTRFDHVYPGAATPGEVGQMIQDLESARVRLLVVSDYWLAQWGPQAGNQPLVDYLNRDFRTVAQYGAYRVLTR